MSTITLAAAVAMGAPLIAAKRARTMSPPMAAEGTRLLIASPIQRIQKRLGQLGRSAFGKRTHHAIASKKIGTK